jgi:hypothetical protein
VSDRRWENLVTAVFIFWDKVHQAIAKSENDEELPDVPQAGKKGLIVLIEQRSKLDQLELDLPVEYCQNPGAIDHGTLR